MKGTIEVDNKIRRHKNIGNNNLVPLPLLKRNNYFYGKLLTVDDFQTEQNYFINKQRLINRVLFGMGVADGLEVKEDEPEDVIRLSEGFALDGYGREVVLSQPVRFDLNKKVIPKDIGTTRDLFVYVVYEEKKVDPVPRALVAGEPGEEYANIAEGAKAEISLSLPDSSSIDKIVLAKVTVRAEGSKISVCQIDNSATVNGVQLRKVVFGGKNHSLELG